MEGSRHICQHVSHALRISQQVDAPNRLIRRLTADEMTGGSADAALTSFHDMCDDKRARPVPCPVIEAARRQSVLHIVHFGKSIHACRHDYDESLLQIARRSGRFFIRLVWQQAWTV
jgi:hypothetical protein